KAGQEPAAQAEPADRGGDPHPLDLGGRASVKLQRTAPDRLGVQGRDQEQARGRGHLVVGGGDAPVRVEARFDACSPLVEVGPQAAAQRRQQTAESQSQSQSGGSAASGGGTVIEVTEETFNTDVVERSRTTPVIMDLWAEWCGPCKQLSPLLEKLAAEAGGQWILAKVDVDANPQLSAALQVQSIPMVVAVVGGQLVDGFLGAMPEAQVRQWLSQAMAVAEKMGMQVAAPADAAGGVQDDADAGLPGEAGAGLPPAYADARAAMERGDLDAAAGAFEQELAANPADPVAKTGLAQVNLIRRVSSYDQAKARRDAAERPGDVAAQARVADIDMATGRN